ncbi:MAG TPA: hypothetical protein VIS99_03185 [Terrimicrobiaceae bacterium]
MFDLEIHQSVAQLGVGGLGLDPGGRTRHRINVSIGKAHHPELELGFETPDLFLFRPDRSTKFAHAASWSASAKINAGPMHRCKNLPAPTNAAMFTMDPSLSLRTDYCPWRADLLWHRREKRGRLVREGVVNPLAAACVTGPK